MITLHNSTKLRVVIKWHPHERDDMGEKCAIDPCAARAQLQSVASQLKFLWWYRKLLFATYLLRNRSRNLGKLVELKKQEAEALRNYLSSEGDPSFDLDLCCCCFDRRGQMVKFVSPRAAGLGEITREMLQGQMDFIHSGDDETGTGNLFDEHIRISLSAIAPEIHQVYFVLASHNHGFHEIDGCGWSVITTQDEKEILSKALAANTSHRIHVMARLVRKERSWGLEEVAEFFPVEIEGKNLGPQLHALIKERFLTTNPARG